MQIQRFFEKKHREYLKRKKRLKRNVFLLKAKFFLICVLPVIIILIAIKTIKTFLKIKLKGAAVSADMTPCQNSSPVKVPVSQTRFRPEFITPSPVSGSSASNNSKSDRDGQQLISE